MILISSVNLSIEKTDIHFIHGFFQEGLPCLETVSVNCTSLTKTTDIFSKVRPYLVFEVVDLISI